MPRRPILAFLLISLALTLGPAIRPSLAAPEPAAGAAGHDDAKPRSPLEAEPSLAIWTVVVFAVLMAILWPLAWKPLLHAMHQREEQMEHTLAAAEHARAESERLLAEHRAQMVQAGEQARAILDEARRAAEASANEIIQKAQAEAEAARHRAEREIGVARDQALTEIFSRTADLAVSVAGRVLKRELGESDQRRLVDVALSELPAGPTSTNGHGGHA